MPTRPRTRCPTCKTLHPGKGQCARCRDKAERDRGTAYQRGYGTGHQRFRTLVLQRDPECVLCLEQGEHTTATVADHYPLSRRELQAAGLDPNNPAYGRGLCTPCHGQETARHQPGGWHRQERG